MSQLPQSTAATRSPMISLDQLRDVAQRSADIVGRVRRTVGRKVGHPPTSVWVVFNAARVVCAGIEIRSDAPCCSFRSAVCQLAASVERGPAERERRQRLHRGHRIVAAHRRRCGRRPDRVSENGVPLPVAPAIRSIQPVRTDEPGAARSISSIASKCDMVGSSCPTACTSASWPELHNGMQWRERLVRDRTSSQAANSCDGRDTDRRAVRSSSAGRLSGTTADSPSKPPRRLTTTSTSPSYPASPNAELCGTERSERRSPCPAPPDRPHHRGSRVDSLPRPSTGRPTDWPVRQCRGSSRRLVGAVENQREEVGQPPAERRVGRCQPVVWPMTNELRKRPELGRRSA